MRSLLWPAGAAAAAAAGLIYVALVDPNEPGHYPLCPLFMLTGLYCPGCGALRATHALTHGDIGTALGMNVLVVALIPVAAVVWARWAVRSWQGRPFAIKAPPPAIVWAFLVLLISYGVVRNLPFGHFLAP
ncbi:DUF2752 domain-containing protein [Thermopolyspora sp. NPDC052614]|uniref:DUF2752 domain-containing protein n=1 Tax=Thermopolyspora sp. NPDC052614 TaxID=3155682 RepID=UPI00342992BE